MMKYFSLINLVQMFNSENICKDVNFLINWSYIFL